MKIVIMGYGVVGKACAAMLTAKEHQFIAHDPPAGLFADLSEVDVAFICVPTPTNFITGHVDISAILQCLNLLSDGTVVLIRSTVLPGMTERLQRGFPSLKLAFVPEFLTEATSTRDALDPNRVVIGLTEASSEVAKTIVELMQSPNPSTPLLVMKSSSAEMAKYVANNFYALKVAFFNEMFDVASRVAGVEWREVMESVADDPWTGAQHTDVFHGGYRGFGGKCLPKDASAMITFARERGFPVVTLEAAEYANKELQRRALRHGK